MTLYFRDGREFCGTPHLTAKGKPTTVMTRSCGRCGGAGRSDRWAYTGYTCFDCGGSGKGRAETVSLYTAEQLARLDVTRAKRSEKRAAVAAEKARVAAAEADARREAFLSEHGALLADMRAFAARSEWIADVLRRATTQHKLSPAQVAAARTAVDRFRAQDVLRAASDHVGAIGERIEFAGTVERVSHYTRPQFGASWLTETVWIVTIRDDRGNALVSKSPRFHAEKGERLTGKATVKEHSEYRGERQTAIQRIKLSPEVAPAAA